MDHAPLVQAAKAGPVLPLFIIEPALWQQPDISGRQYAFMEECLHELHTALAGLGQPLLIMVGDAISCFEKLHATHGISNLWSHEETGNGWTFDRDKAVAAWCRHHEIGWHECRQNGVIRRLKNRDGWANAWDQQMAQPMLEPPQCLRTVLAGLPFAIPAAQDIGLQADPCPMRQKGGRRAALAVLESFLNERGEPYRRAMSSPAEGAKACSRLSPHLAWGTLSPKETIQATWQRQRTLKQWAQAGKATGDWRDSMKSFSGRLHWRCHFMQKLEDEPALEFENLHPAYNDLRPAGAAAEKLAAWAEGKTGYPFVDACMRSLNATGWLNFRMRAMVMSFASYHLWLNWRETGLVLARLFTDYEPGIHWPQVQMQSGTTGINAVRIYNPVKQGHDQDPNGYFIREWVPEIAHLPDTYVHEPWLAPLKLIEGSYPVPIVDLKAAGKLARERIWSVRAGEGFKGEAHRILKRHGSRSNDMRQGVQRKNRHRQTKPQKAANTSQLSLF